MKCLLLLLISFSLFAEPIRYEMNLQDEVISYYIDMPDVDGTVPLVLVIEGSYCADSGPQSILHLHEVMVSDFHGAAIGVATIERRGVDGHDKINVEKYHAFNTPTQRLLDHLKFVEHLQARPPERWNGQLFILGGSEGGPIAIKLAHSVNPAACVVLVGCGDQTFKEYIWHTLQSAPFWKRVWVTCIGDMPFTRASYEARVARMKSNPTPEKFWYGQTYRYWADALDQFEMDAFLQLKCPVFVVTGTQDIECPSTDRLIARAKAQGQDVTYLRVEGMAHGVLDSKWNVMPKILDFFIANKTMQ
ncbi:MAG: alpha/beta hydrolase [Chlamydiia bacterium]|nr:alpha/beta hydrolase [Chlamydiia bacterium]